MKLFKHAKTLVFFLGALCSSIAAVSALANDKYPNRPVRIVVPFPAGGSADMLGRAIAHGLEGKLGRPFVVDNVSGASTMIGAERVARSEADGYTLLVASSTTLSTNPHLLKKMTYKLEDFVGVSMISQIPLVFATSPKAPFKTLQELVAYAKANPGKVAYGTTGKGGMSHLVGEMASSAMGIQMMDVPYRGSAPALADVMGDQIPIHVDGAATSFPLYRAGKINVLAMTSVKRSETVTDVPTFTELGYPDVVAGTRYGLFAPVNTPPAVVERLNAAMKEVLADAVLRERFRPSETELQWSTSDEVTELFRSDRERFGKIMKNMNIEMQ